MSISRVMKGGMPCIEETRPVGGPKYYVVTIAGRRGRCSAVACKVVHKVIGTGTSCSEATAEERGYKVDYRLEKGKAEDDRQSSRKLGSWLANLFSVLDKDDGTVDTGCIGQGGHRRLQ